MILKPYGKEWAVYQDDGTLVGRKPNRTEAEKLLRRSQYSKPKAKAAKKSAPKKAPAKKKKTKE